MIDFLLDYFDFTTYIKETKNWDSLATSFPWYLKVFFSPLFHVRKFKTIFFFWLIAKATYWKTVNSEVLYNQTFLWRTLIFLSLMSRWSLTSFISEDIRFFSCVAWTPMREILVLTALFTLEPPELLTNSTWTSWGKFYDHKTAVYSVADQILFEKSSDLHCIKVLLSITDMFVTNHKEKLSLINHKIVCD